MKHIMAALLVLLMVKAYADTVKTYPSTIEMTIPDYCNLCVRSN